MKTILLLLLFASPVLAQTPVVSGGTSVIGAGAPGAGASVTASSVASAISSQSGCNIAGYVWQPSTNTCVAAPTATNGVSSADQANTGSGSGSNGIGNALAACTTFTCMVQVSKIYASTAEPSVAFTGLNQVVTDNRGGNNWIRSNDLTPGTLYRENIHNFLDCGVHRTGSTVYLGNVPNLIGDCLRVSLNVTAPGFNNGAGAGGVNDAWPTAHPFSISMLHQGGGIKGIIDSLGEATGPGDLHFYDYLYFSGGQGREPGAEGVGRQMHVSERTTHYTGNITAVSSGTLTTTSTGAGSVKNLGADQRIIDTTARMSTGYVTTVTPFGDGFVSVGLSGGGLTASAWTGTLDAAIHVPTIPSTGSNAVGTSVTFNITTAAGSAAPVAGQGFNLTLPAIEHCVVTNVSTLSANHYAITASVRLEHTPGGRIQQWAGRAGFEWVANTVTTPDSLTLRYDLDVVGAVDSSHAIVTAIATGNATGLPYGLVDFGAFPISSGAALVNTGGVVTVTSGVGNFINNHPDLYGTTVTIAGATNSAFNTACTNARNLNPAAGTFDCSQSGSTGQTSAANSSSTIGLGNQPTGNTAYNVYPAANVIDIQRYPAGANPVVDGTLRLEPYDTTAFTVGHAISQDHDYVLLQSLTNYYQDAYNPYSFNSGMDFSAITGPNGSSANENYSALQRTNFTPFGFYKGLGGYQGHPKGLRLSGVWGSTITVDNPTPQEPLLSVLGCPFTGCTDPNATTPLWYQLGNGGADSITYNISRRTLAFTPPISVPSVNGVPLSTTAGASSFLAGDGTYKTVSGGAAAGGALPLPASLSTALLADYNFYQQSGTTLTDASGNGNDGTLRSGGNAPTWTTQGLLFQPGQGVSLPAALNPSNTVAMEVYVNPMPQSGSLPTNSYPALMTSSLGGSGLNLLIDYALSGSSLVGNYTFAPSIYAGGQRTSSQTVFAGFHTLTYTLGAGGGDLDRFYLDGIEVPNYNVQVGSAGLMTSGNLYLGASPDSLWSTSGLSGTMYRVRAYSSKLAAADVYTLSQAMIAEAQTRGIPTSPVKYPLNTPQMHCVGDSITYGSNSSSPYCALLSLTNQPTYTITNWGIPGTTTIATAGSEANRASQLCKSNAGPSVAIDFLGTNDLTLLAGTTPQGTLRNLMGAVQIQKLAGCKVLVGTMISRTGNDQQGATADSDKNAYDALILSQAKSLGADGIVDFAADPNLGADGAYASGTYFSSDHVHPSLAGQQLLANAASNALNYYFGSKPESPTVVTSLPYTMTAGNGALGLNISAAGALTLPSCIGQSGAVYTINNPQSTYAVTVIGATTSQPINGLTTAITIPSNATIALRDVANPKSVAGCHWEF